MEMVHFIPPSQRRLAMLAAQADTAPVLIHGGSGTGKGAIARWIHGNGPRAARSLVIATQDRALSDQIPEAQGGTLVIPEIGSWSLGEQKVLLNYLQTRSVSVAGDESGELRKLVNARVIATTTHALDGRAQGGLFNAELLEKLNVFRIEMPTLSKRTEEFDDIVNGIVREICRELHKDHVRGLDEAAWNKLRAYEWPGNLRELRNVLRVSVIAAKTELVTGADVPEFGVDRVDFRATREEFERIYILELLKTFDFQVDRAVRGTRMDKPTLLSKIKKYGIEVQPSIQ